MDLEETYQDIIKDLKNGGRGQIKLTSEDVAFLENALTSDKLNQVLCILCHDQGFHQELTPALSKLIQKIENHETLIFALSAFSRHGIAAKLRDGHPVDPETLKMLESLLHHKNHEVIEWTLRTIDEMGSQGRYFLPQFKGIKPGTVSTLFNQHKKNIKEIIQMLENRWRIPGKN